MNISGTDTLIIYDNVTEANNGTYLTSAALDTALASGTGYDLEFYGEAGQLKAILKLGDTVVKEISGNSDTACNYGEMGFVASDANNSGLEIKMRHFTVYTGQ